MELVLKFICFMYVFKTRNTTENVKEIEIRFVPFWNTKTEKKLFFNIFADTRYHVLSNAYFFGKNEDGFPEWNWC